MYFIGKYEVTVAQFAAFVEDAAYEADPRSLVGPADHPVRDVSWHDAMAYCAWLTGKLRAWTGTPPALADVLRGGDDLGAGLAGPRRVLPAWQVTLPSEAEWEKAARGDDARDYPWGNGLPNSTRASYSATEPSAVGSHPAGASPFEVFDMAGNVFEWTRSLWGPDVSRARFRYPYEPDDGRENLEAPATIRRVLRGGSFRLGPDGISTTRRFRYDPDSRFGTRGFRLAVSLLVPLPPVSPDPPASPISSPSPISPPVPALPGRD